ncbi:MAG: VWA domain-containing protein [Calditrichaeota bacterium]|nr:MAG: VWA domain-containing protein [Calditrichota bacterium]
MFRFANPEYLILLVLIPLLGVYYWRRGARLRARMKFSTLRYARQAPRSWRQVFRQHLYLVRLAILSLLILGLARPQSGSRQEEVITEGIDIMLVLDVSTSMLAEDFKPKNRIEAAKTVAREFIQGRRNDPIGLVIFAREAFTQCPLTLDYGVLLQILEKTEVANPEWDGTAIGNGIATAVARLKDGKAKSKVIILLTDGENNAGEVDPITAAQIAHTFDIRIYTIGAGTRGTAMYPFDHPIFGKQYKPIPVEIDEELLTRIAEITGAKYFRATNTEKLRSIYKEIGELEKTRIEVKEFTKYHEEYLLYALIAFALIVVELIANHTILRKLP